MKGPIAILGGSGVRSLITGVETVLGTPYGPTPKVTLGELNGRKVAFMPRHGETHSSPPHKVNYRANIWGLKSLGVDRVIATNAVGAIDSALSPGEIVIPSDLIDFTKSRRGTFYEGPPVTHIDVSEPYCPTIRKILIAESQTFRKQPQDDTVMACTEGPRYETPAEIRMFRGAGCGIVGMTGAPEAFLSRELEMCYATVCFVSNMAAGLQRKLSALEVEERGKDAGRALSQILPATISTIPDTRKGCSCGTSLNSAQLTSTKETERGEPVA